MRDDDNSDACDEAPRTEDKCYTRGRLRDEFRMKPAPGAQPVRMYRSPYGGKYGVWRLADCIPMRAKRPQTEKQRDENRTLLMAVEELLDCRICLLPAEKNVGADKPPGNC